MNQSMGSGAARLRSSVSAILRNCRDERLAAAVTDEVDYLVACSESDCSVSEMREYIHTVWIRPIVRRLITILW